MTEPREDGKELVLPWGGGGAGNFFEQLKNSWIFQKDYFFINLVIQCGRFP
jgi:hypothetical protein